MNAIDAGPGYASWISPDGSFTIIYSLALFGEIDATVSDGYRRIPHGGVESAGLLFGTRAANADGRSCRIEAYRPITCQHAFGPSFILSDDDRSDLRQQLADAAADSELEGLEPLGWFIGHTRGPLEINDREPAWFDEFFPGPFSLFILIKPERFQPTRFVFLWRDAAGQLPRQSSSAPVLLPLSASQINPPSAQAANPRQVEIPLEEPQAISPDTPPIRPGEPVDSPRPTGQTTRIRVPQRPMADPPEEFTSPAASPVNPPPAAQPQSASRPPSSDPGQLAYPYASLARGRTRDLSSGSGSFGLRSAAILLVAAILGCVAGYWAYLQLPSPVIPVSVREDRNQLLVEWPATQTDGIDYAAMQVNEGQWVTLSAAEKAAGRAVINAPANGDLKIDLVAKHWLRDSRGIVRYLRSPAR